MATKQAKKTVRTKKCEDCQGKGFYQVIIFKFKCVFCNGSGKVPIVCKKKAK